MVVPTLETLAGTQEYVANEARVNGIFNSVLSQHFPANKFLINPEAYPNYSDTTGLKADLLVSGMSWEKGLVRFMPVIAYEGKGGGGDEWDRIREHLGNWIALSNTGRKTMWAMGARGDEVKFWRYDSRNPEGALVTPQERDKLRPIDWNADAPYSGCIREYNLTTKTYNGPDMLNPYKFSTQSAIIGQILRAIDLNPLATTFSNPWAIAP
jgi:hypothetical protein